MTTTQAKPGDLRVGFAKQDITPPLPFPLAGMVDKKGRMADRIRDPLYARALVMTQGKKTVAVVCCDILLITAVLREAAQKAILNKGLTLDGLMLSATHTHSGVGAYWDSPSAAMFMGKYSPPVFDRIVAGICDVVIAAAANREPGELYFGETRTDGLNYNRRHKDGPIDPDLGVLTIRRKSKDIRVVAFGAHPVVVAFREYNSVSACWPGELIKAVEADGPEGMFITGPVGGVNVLFPEGPMKLDTHMGLLIPLLQKQVALAVENQEPVQGNPLAYAAGETIIHVTLPKLFPDSKAWADVLAYPLRLWVRKFGKGGLRDGKPARFSVVRIGDLILTGFPADLGAGVGLSAKARIKQAGFRTLVVASQTDDYVGYVHLPPEYQQFESKDKAAMWMNIYENAMAFGGRQVGTHMLAALDTALSQVLAEA